MAVHDMLMAAGGVSTGPATYVDDVFSTYLYTGNGNLSVGQNIINGIDLATKGGMVWTKVRSTTGNNVICDTVQGPNLGLVTNDTSYANSTNVQGFLTNGFNVAGTTPNNVNGATNASWTFRKQAKFFDVVTYTGTGATQTINHNLGSVPGCIIVKAIDANSNWCVYHRSIGNTQFLSLNLTNAAATLSMWGNTDPTSTTFTTGGFQAVGQAGTQYVAYLFAHDAGGFGASGTDNVISCGSFSCSPSGTATVNLGYEPQWILAKDAANAGSWELFDNMRGMSYSGTEELVANTAGASYTYNPGVVIPTATGFTVTSSSPFGASSNIIYIAIRRPMKPPTTGTEVFSPVFGQATAPGFQPNIVTDSYFMFYKPGDPTYPRSSARLIGNKNLQTSSTAAENTDAEIKWDYQNGTYVGAALDNTFVAHCFRRAPGFFDEVCWTTSGTDVNERVKHNLTVPPELIIMKTRAVSTPWYTYNANLGRNYYLYLNTTAASASYADLWGTSNPTSTDFGINASVFYGSSNSLVAYLFATVAGVSKVGSYTGTGTTQQINCGFSGGARFVMIKRTDSTGDWYVWDTARGIVSGNDPYLRLNSTGGEVTNTDYIDPYSAGFEISSTAPAAINANGGSFIFLAIA